ncbi:MAG: pilus assembly protein [Amphiplicatus sp.]
MSRPASFLRRLANSDAGATALEFAIVCPLIFAFTFGTFETGRALYQRNKIAAACSDGARMLEIKGADDEDDAEAAIEARFNSKELENLTVSFTEENIDGVNFKKVEVSYDHDFLIKFHNAYSGVTLIATRYAPMMS